MAKLLLALIVSLFSYNILASVSIPKTALNKSLIFNSYAKKSNGLYNYSKAYRVRFKEAAGVLTLESDNGELRYEFQIIGKSQSKYEVDLRSGLNLINFQSSIYKTELSLNHPQLKKYSIPASSFSSVEVLENSDERLLVKVKLAVPGYDSIVFEITSLRNPFFSPRSHEMAEKVGVYSTYPDVNDLKFLSKQSMVTTYLYAPDFPEDLLLPLKYAVDYWNNALGSKLIKLQKAPSRNMALKVGVNYIDYYSDRDDDGGARGIFSLDPKSGEIISSYIYIPSGFKVWGTKYFQEQYPESSSTFINQAVLDYLTHTIAHEIGHTLGLRHNFAASTESNINAKNYQVIISNYMTDLYVDELVVPATSSMDYISIDYFALIGAKMRLGQTPLSYDVRAVQWIYLDKSTSYFGNFCTHYDEPPTLDRGGSLFCQAWDEPHSL